MVAQAAYSADLELPHLFSILALTLRAAIPGRESLGSGQTPIMYIKMRQMVRGC